VLFFQVEDLEALFASATSPEAVRRYLTDLLADMAKANALMTRRTLDEEDGGDFALEASQYLRRTGGRDARGLAFELQGLHALADEQLRPPARGDLLYAEGVNRALRRRADRDDLVHLFATAGIIMLGVLCAPLGATVVSLVTGVARIAVAVRDVVEAGRLGEEYRAFERPEEVLHWQEVQVAGLTATLSIIFSVFDVVGIGAAVGRSARELVAAARIAPAAVEGTGASAVLSVAQQQIRRVAVQGLTREVLEQALRQAAHEVAVVAVMETLLPLVVTPVLAAWLQRKAGEHGTLEEPRTADALRKLSGPTR
jgi:hypothetical protein